MRFNAQIKNMDDKKFSYTYTTPSEGERKEIYRIRNQYLPKQQDGEGDCVDKLRKLDKKIKLPARITSIVMGAIGFCCFGMGMTMTLEWDMILWGALLGITGLALMTSAYFAYNSIFARRKSKYAEQVLQLSQNLLGEKADNVSLNIAQHSQEKDKSDGEN